MSAGTNVSSRRPRRILILLFIAAGCGEGPAPPPEPHHHETDRRTVWTDRFEVFIEHQLIAAGMPATFVTHVTDLERVEPLRAGALRFVLRSGDEAPLEVVDPAPARAGIYTPKLRFPGAGAWDIDLHIAVDGGEARVPLGSFTVYASHEETHIAGKVEGPEGIAFSKEDQWKLGTRTEAVAKRRMVERLRVPGRVAARPGSRAALTTPIAGRLLGPPDGGLPSLGARVKAGQTLARIQAPFSELFAKLVESEANLIRTKLGVELAELTHSRIRDLAEQKVRSARDREEADFALRTARANHESALALREAYQEAGTLFGARGPDAGGSRALPALVLEAPIGGLVTSVAAAVGEHVTPDRPILTILDPDRVYIEAKVPESDLGRVASPGAAAYELLHAPGELHPLGAGGYGRMIHFGPEVDPATRSVPLVYEIENPAGKLRVGLALEVYLETSRAEEVLAVPETALVDEGGIPVAFVQLSGETFEKRYLGLGIRDGGYAEIESGIAEGERVVTRRAYALRLASVSASIPDHGHEH